MHKKHCQHSAGALEYGWLKLYLPHILSAHQAMLKQNLLLAWCYAYGTQFNLHTIEPNASCNTFQTVHLTLPQKQLGRCFSAQLLRPTDKLHPYKYPPTSCACALQMFSVCNFNQDKTDPHSHNNPESVKPKSLQR